MCPPVVLAGAALATAAIGTGVSIAQGNARLKAEKKAAAQAQAQADAAYAEQDRANNRANQKKPDISTIIAATRGQGRGGQSGTMLTGPRGVAGSALTLGKPSLLGG